MEKMSYSRAIDRLNEIMQQMESGALDVDSLADTLKEARELVGFCKDKLHKVEESIKEN